jgi:predicted acylesterase/phospholipase RssA
LSLTNTKPLAKKIEENFTQEILSEIAAEHWKGKRLFISTTNVEAQRGVIWDIGAIANSGNPDALKLFHQILLASASVPGIFQPVFIEVQVGDKHYNEIHYDGGVVSQVFVYPLKIQRSVIDEFLRYHLERHLYVVSNSKVTPEYKDLQPSFFTLTRRAIETLSKNHGLGAIYRLYIASVRDGIDYNLVYIPESFSAESKELFDPDYMSKLFDVGYAMGKRSETIWLKKPPGVDYQQ